MAIMVTAILIPATSAESVKWRGRYTNVDYGFSVEIRDSSGGAIRGVGRGRLRGLAGFTTRIWSI